MPVIRSEPDTMIALIGDKVSLEVRVDQPTIDTKIQWLLNGQEILNATQETSS